MKPVYSSHQWTKNIWNAQGNVDEGIERRENRLGSHATMHLFAYCEVLQATVGFSSFELLHERGIRGPLDVLQTCEVDSAARY